MNMSILHSIRNLCWYISKAFKIVWFVYFHLWLISLFSLFRRIKILLLQNFMPKVPSGILDMSISIFEGTVTWKAFWWCYLELLRSLIADFMAKMLNITISDHRTSKIIFRYRAICRPPQINRELTFRYNLIVYIWYGQKNYWKIKC